MSIVNDRTNSARKCPPFLVHTTMVHRYTQWIGRLGVADTEQIHLVTRLEGEIKEIIYRNSVIQLFPIDDNGVSTVRVRSLPGPYQRKSSIFR